ncbi:MAG: hypothetical protein HY744_10055 [Deltaproteobacteria bacterium]|nr:hypothetical protein [Deltaproteobacteria bacterium]
MLDASGAAPSFQITLVACDSDRLWDPIYLPGRPGAWRRRPSGALGDWWLPAEGLVGAGAMATARFVEIANPGSKGRDGYRIVRTGGGSGPLPVPAKGESGCRHAMLGHGQLETLRDGRLLGLGSLCTSGDDELTVLFVHNARNYFVPRLGKGPPAAELWSSGVSRVDRLPGGNRLETDDYLSVHELPSGEILIAAMGERTEHPKTDSGKRPYVARFDGKIWTEITPADAPRALEMFPTPEEIFFLGAEAFRLGSDDVVAEGPTVEVAVDSRLLAIQVDRQ